MFGTLAAVGATGGAAACAADPPGTAMEQPSGRTIKVGLISPAVGPYRTVGADITNGFKLYLADHGNLLGRHRVDLRIEDEGATAALAVAAVEALLQSGVIVLAGVASPASLTAIRAAVEKAKVPLVSSNASPSTLTSAFYIWRASYVEGAGGRARSRRTPRSRETGPICSTTTPRRRGRRRTASAAPSKTGVARSWVTTLGPETMPGACRVRGTPIRTPSSPPLPAGAAQDFLDAYRRSGMTTKVLGPGSLTETVDLPKLAPLPQQVYTAMPYAYDLDNESNRRFVSSYHKTYGKAPSVYAMTAYDAASVIDKGLRLIEDDVPAAVALNQAFSLLGQIDSPRGAWTFDINRTPQQKWYLRRLRLDGQVAGNLLDTDLTVLS